MVRRLWVALALAAVLTSPLFAARRRAVSPGTGRCTAGTLLSFADVSNLALDDTYIYFVSGFGNVLQRMPKDGGDVEDLALLQDRAVFAIAVDDTHVYLTTLPFDAFFSHDPGDIVSVPKLGGEVRVLAAGAKFPVALDIDDTHVYWSDIGGLQPSASGGKVERVRKDGTGRQELASELSVPFDVMVDANNVYFAEFPFSETNPKLGLRSVPKGGGAITHISDDVVAIELAQNGNDIIFDGGSVETEKGGIYRIPKSGGAPVLLAEAEDVPAGPKVIDGMVYYATQIDEETDALMRVPVSGGTPQFVLTPGFGFTAEFVLDECAVYYPNRFGQLIKSPR